MLKYCVSSKFKRMLKILFFCTIILFSHFFECTAIVHMNSQVLKIKRKSDIMCAQYIDTFRDTVWLQLLPRKSPISFKTRCKKPVNPLIVSGSISQVGEFPHVVALGLKNTDEFIYFCAGTLISEKWILTVAHCVQQQFHSVKTVFLGSNNFLSPDGIFMPVKRIIIHPEFEEGKYRMDIALVEMLEQVAFGDHVKPACLRVDEEVAGKVLVASWGASYLETGYSDTLKKIRLDVVENSFCATKYNVDELPRGIEDSMLCAGDVNGGWRRDTCSGDSGAPLQMLHVSGCLFEIVGLTSVGKFCAFTDTPGVYTKVSYFVNWIESIVWHDNKNFDSNPLNALD